MKVALDTNCFIDVNNPNSSTYSSLSKIFELANKGKIELYISRHTLDELSKKPDRAYALAKTITILSYWPVGSWDDLVGTWKDLTGTWDDIGRNNLIKEEIKNLAKSGTSIRDQGAYIDSLHSKIEFFITSDKKMAKSNPAKRLYERFGLKVITPKEVCDKFFNYV
ncbi:MAG: PIN domain-containing protein [Candidatus Omnitrophica bacterium]|nr:PIN domain-containing protein [Candidatus Omnitrophota bacterium]MBU1047512.1 PIN domain-containing protein [Candidatus Omnitrophota bacterium]MBU1631239.1 PIN domain-containing protein [Candidatus Omnitrophota bacterium]MBU1766771.1 PIN domain-containing protein [Candidatus Omnitrophota bacterium]MBU1888875.1 PIN domain-containing protein [Candidatus Omnitrophota bacterium]